NKGRLSEKDIDEVLRQIRLALLEADVNFKVVKSFLAAVREKAITAKVLESLAPAQQMIKIVNEELIAILGGSLSQLKEANRPPSIIMLVGLQGSGKTTTAAKLAMHLKYAGQRPLLVAADIRRPAAIDQLVVLGKQLDIPVYQEGDKISPLTICKNALKKADELAATWVVIDTQGRLHIDDELMGELTQLRSEISPSEIILVVDAMTGQDAVNAAGSFHEQLGIDGIIITKLDSDTRGGAALTVKAVTGCPVKFAGIGEKLDELEPFHPERMASRILGMGDVLSLIEKAQESLDEKKAADLERKLKTDRFTLVDYLEQMQQLKKMGPLNKILGMLPGINIKQLENAGIDEKKMARTEAIILSMTQKERLDPALLNFSRKKRVAAGSGTSVQDINILLKGYEDMRKLFKQMNQGSRRGPLAGGGRNPFGGFRF
ncbi:MAG TPA: signal recognition particle protein, partial [Clostridiales bacterium]|nr:signal recognition particle protein [Clostridiales bacterium]